MREYSKEELKECLQAWNEWKDICCVEGCQVNHAEILRKLINGSFMDKLSESLKKLIDFSSIDFTNEFDCAIWECENVDRQDKRSNDPKKKRKKKAWKDEIWTAIKNNPNEPPLRIIHGKLLGDKSIMNDFIENYLTSNYNLRLKTILVGEQKKHVIDIVTSIDAPVDDDNPSVTLGDTLVSFLAPEMTADEEADCHSFVQSLTNKQIVLFLAHIAKVNLTAHGLPEYFGLTPGSRHLYETTEVFFKRDMKEDQKAFCREMASRKNIAFTVEKEMFFRLKQEKRLSDFLMQVEDSLFGTAE